MSISSRIQYKYRSFTKAIFGFGLPPIFTGVAARVTIMSLVVLMSAVYIVQVSHLTAGGYEIASLERQERELKDEAQKINAEVASYQSLPSIQTRLQGVSMVPVGQIHYLKGDSEMAKR